jgi:eukaryotic-like serine/threonine-protein kinase
MPPVEWHKVEEIFEEALDVPPEERSVLIERRCGADAELRGEVQSLLAAEAASANFLPKANFAKAVGSLLTAEAREGQRVGPYKILREVGRGGMGVVLLAEREDEEFHQQVAIKVVKRGFDTEDILRRFRNERQILASLNHPNIAKLFDGGSTEDGLPYFVMEYIEGLPLVKYCDEHELSTNERLRLFRDVCSAVQHAHQNLVIHRDIKPSNILVTREGEVKLLDFGVARLLSPGESGTEATATQTALRLMTPEYASPEQVRGERLTTATDIYSLGVILYELLTGARPYKLKDTSPAELSRAICDLEPSRPSEAVTDSKNLSSDSKSETRNPKALRGDIDNIVLMALRKEPGRRYKSAEQFAEDIRRHLTGLPVIARKDTFAYRTSKFVRRNRVAVLTASLIILVIISGLIVALWQAEAARRQRDLAQRERVKAERINQFLQRMLSFSNQSITSVSPVAQRRDVTVNDMLDQITPQVEAELADQPDVRAQILRAIGSAYASQGQYDAAEKNLRAALDAQTRLYGEENVEAAATMVELGVLSYRQAKFDEASRLLEKAVAFYRKQRQANSSEYSAAKLAQALDHLGVVKFYQGDAKTCLSLLNEALQIASSANLQGPERGVLASIKTDLGGVLVMSTDPEKGENLLRESLAEYRQISSRPRWEVGATLMMLGIAALKRNQPNEAVKHLVESEQILRETLGDDNPYLARTLERQAAALSLKNDLQAAEKKARESLAISQKQSTNNVVAATPAWTLGDILVKAGRVREGEDYYRQALAIHERQATKIHPLIVQLKIRLSQFLLAQNRLDEAERITLEARAEADQHLGEQNPLTKAATDILIKIYEKQGKHDLARKLT